MNKRVYYVVVCCLLMTAGLSAAWYFSEKNNDIKAKEQLSEEELEGGIPMQDRMDLAMEQEFELTRDPATNTVPRERLMLANAYAEQLRANAAGGRIAGAIPGITWVERGPDNVGGRTRAIMVDPNDATKKSVWAGGVGGGLWKTTDVTAANPIWNAADDFFANLAITAMAYDPGNTQVMYFGTGEGFFNADYIRGNGIFKTTNGGATWSQLAATNNSNFYYVQRLVVKSNGEVYAATRSGLFRSTNGGTSWTQVLGAGNGSSSSSISDVEVAADGTMYAAIGIFTQDGVYKSSTGAAGSWTKLNTGANGFAASGFQRIEIACAPSNANYIYALAQGTGSGISQILRSTDAGANWSVRTNPVDADGGVGADFTRSQAWYDLAAAVDPNNENTLYVGGVDLFKSTNGASSWQQIAHWYGGFGFQDVHADQHAIIFEPGNSSVIYFGNDGGVWRSGNGTATIPTITHKSKNYNVTQFYACAMNPTAYSSQFMAGAQDNGTQQYSSLGINSTVEKTGGDGCFCHIDQDQPQYQFSSYVYNNYYRSTNTGASFTGITNNNNGSFVNPTDYDDANNNLYACFGNGTYYVILNAPASGTLNSRTVAAFNSGKVTHISVSPNTSNRVFFGLNNGRVVRVDNANNAAPTGTNITGAGMPTTSVSCIAVETGNDNHLLATYSSYGVTSVWETTNGGTSWTSVEGNLPDMPVRWALFSPVNAQQALIATELGVWSTDLLSGGATVWAPSNTGQANVRTDMLQMRTSDNLVIAATHGRGLFSTDAFSTPYPDFTSDKQLSYTGKQIAFTDASYKSTSWAWDFGDGTTATSQNPAKTYSSPGLYTVVLQINGNSAYTKTKTSYILILPNKGIPYDPTMGGSFDTNPIDFGAELISGTPFERGNSAIAGKSGTKSGSFAWVTGLTASTYADNTDASVWTPNYNFSAPGIYTLKFYRKNIFESGYDGFRVEYSLDKGSNWTALGNVTASWYDFANATTTTAFPLNEPYFNGTKSAFTLCQYDVSSLAGNANVAFRLRFKSDVSVNAAGMAIDDFEISGPSNGPLPVELVSFSGEPSGSDNLLKWLTLSEVENKQFDLERSADGYTFSHIATISGKGTISSASAYQYVDKGAERNYYYKLSQTDYNGTVRVLGIVLVKRKASGDLVRFVYPNPFRESFSIVVGETASKTIQVDLYDTGGKRVYSAQHAVQDYQVTVTPAMAETFSGTYLLKVTSGDKVWTGKMIRQ